MGRTTKGEIMTNPNNYNGQQPAYQPANVPPVPQQQYAPAAPAAPAYAAAPVNDKWNGLAIAAFIFGLLGGLLGLIFGIIALNQIKKNGGKGKGLAIAGIVLFIVWIVLGIIVNVAGGSASALALALAL